MSTLRIRHLGLASVAGLLLFISPSWLTAGKPQPPPPPPPPNPFEIYEDRRADLGGWLDTQRNLVWGYSLTETRNSSCTYNGANWFAQSYASQLADEAVFRTGRAEYTQARGNEETALGDEALAIGDVESAAYHYNRAAQYYALSERYAADALGCADASVVAGQFTNWRVPTKAEALDAVAKGFFTYGEGGFNRWDSSPNSGMQELPYGGVLTWTADRKGTQSAYAFRPSDGSGGWIGVNSAIDCIVVRNYVPQ